MSYTSTGGLASLPRLAVAGVDQGAPESGLAGGLGGAASANTLTLPTQASAPTAPASGVVLYANSSGRLAWRSASDGFSRSIVVTATADRVFTMPNASLTVAGQNFANTFSVLQVFSANGALSAPAVSFTGTPIAGGTATTTKPLVWISNAATDNNWSTNGTFVGINAATGFAGRLIHLQVNAVDQFYVASNGTCGANLFDILSTAGYVRWNGDTYLTRKATANLQLGQADASTASAQKLSRQSVVAGTSDTAGALFTDVMSLGTGNAASGSTGRQTGIKGASGTTQQTAGWRDFISGKDTVLTEATATTLFTVTVGTGKYLGMIVECTVFASDGTDFQVLHSTLRINTGNKAGTIGTTGIMQTDCATPYNSSGTLTPVTYTLVDNGSGVLAVKCAATSSLVQTTLSCKYHITSINSSDAITITPA